MLAKFVNGDNIDNVDIIENVVAFGKSDNLKQYQAIGHKISKTSVT